MTNAQTGNSLIPGYPGVAPAAPAPTSVDFWKSLEQQIEPTEDYEGNQLSPPVQPQQGQPVPSAAPEPGYALPAQEAQLTPEQMQAIAQFQQQPAAPQAQPQLPQEAQIVAHLAKTEYFLTPELAERMVTEPAEVFPELAARLHVRISQYLGQAVSQMLPSIVASVVEQKMTAVKLEQEFFRQYPQLSDPRFRNVVMHSIALARQVYPNATREQIMTDGAMLAATKLRISLQQPQAQAPVAVQPQQQARPQTNGQVPPFVPMQGGSGGVGSPTQQPASNEFESLALDPNW